ncbi:MAG: hypothetical protein B7Z48_03995 [Thiotrichales bacterium 12-47-6]|nr:MAG: hypothetical protein B7Z48_03995 [Thiotrichales bacterium 12-47-6]
MSLRALRLAILPVGAVLMGVVRHLAFLLLPWLIYKGVFAMSDTMIVVKANRPLRFFAIAMATLVIVAHFVGHINLTEDWLFWIVLAMSANAVSLAMRPAVNRLRPRKPVRVSLGALLH